MLRYSLLAGLIVTIVVAASAATLNAGDSGNSTRLAVNVMPDADTQRADDPSPAAGEADTGVIGVAVAVPVTKSYFPAGLAVASDDNPAGTGYADNVAASLAGNTVGAAPAGTLSASGSACVQEGLADCLCCRACPCIYGDVEFLYFQERPRYRDQPLLIDDITGNVLQTTSDLGFVDDPGVRATFGLRMCGCRAVEFTYFGLFRNGTSSVFENPDPATIVMTFPTGPQGNVFLNMNRVQTDYSTYLNSFEVNFPCCCGCCTQNSCGCDDGGCDARCDKGAGGEATCGEASCGDCASSKSGRCNLCCRSIEWFAGFRYIELGNDMNIGVESFPALPETGQYTLHTVNRLFGGQIGGRIRGTINRFGLELTGKAGIYDNDATESQTVIDFPNFPLRPTTSAQGNFAAFEGELNLSGVFRLNNTWSVKAGYSVIWIEGLALSPDQLDFNFATSPSGNQLSTAGGMFLHGVNVGLEARW